MKWESVIQNSPLGLPAAPWLDRCWLVAGLFLVRLERPLSRIVAFDPPDVASEVHLERPLSRIVAFDPPDVSSEVHVRRPL